MTIETRECDTHQYDGFSYQQASQEGARLIERAHRSGLWANDLPERLFVLRGIMERRRRYAAAEFTAEFDKKMYELHAHYKKAGVRTVVVDAGDLW
ncbi:hypothetical protein [Chelativorans xinjiangense]|uniref:hypothetical protein n=1 Tax=Chelativorans xinjiangense TaxID=2681485 RepID=UPI0013585C85|nr:hypothetical protein [Chelativorans xinjiangense]